MSSNKLTDAEARQLLEMTKKSLVQEINFPTRGNEKEFDVVGDTKKDIFAIKIYRGKIQPFKYNIGARIKKNGTMLLELHISPSKNLLPTASKPLRSRQELCANLFAGSG